MSNENPIIAYLKKNLEPIHGKLKNIITSLENIRKSIDDNSKLARKALDVATTASQNAEKAATMAENKMEVSKQYRKCLNNIDKIQSEISLNTDDNVFKIKELEDTVSSIKDNET